VHEDVGDAVRVSRDQVRRDAGERDEAPVGGRTGESLSSLPATPFNRRLTRTVARESVVHEDVAAGVAVARDGLLASLENAAKRPSPENVRAGCRRSASTRSESTLTRDRGSCAPPTFDPVAIDATAAADRETKRERRAARRDHGIP
jgi:hypothetical protein